MENALAIFIVTIVIIAMIIERFTMKTRDRKFREKLSQEEAIARKMFENGDVYGACQYLRNKS